MLPSPIIIKKSTGNVIWGCYVIQIKKKDTGGIPIYTLWPSDKQTLPSKSSIIKTPSHQEILSSTNRASQNNTADKHNRGEKNRRADKNNREEEINRGEQNNRQEETSRKDLYIIIIIYLNYTLYVRICMCVYIYMHHY